MTSGGEFYLALVVIAFSVFGLTLAATTWYSGGKSNKN